MARSLRKRDCFPEIFSELLWLNYTLGTIKILGNRIKAVVHYEKWFQDGREQMLSLAAGIGLPKAACDQLPMDALQRIIDPALNHGSDKLGMFALPGMEENYRLLLAENYEAAISQFVAIERRVANADLGLAAALQSSVGEIARLQHQVAKLHYRLAEENLWRRSLLSSWSWRLTAPVRWVGSIFLD